MMSEVSNPGRPETPPSTPASLLSLALLIGLCLLAGWAGSIATTPNIPTWYAGLDKPPLTPPNAVFPIVWTILYVLMALAAWFAWRSSEAAARSTVLAPFFLQLGLNVAWSFAFFGSQRPAAGLAVILLLLLAIGWTILTFSRVSRLAALLLLPYLAWVAFATYLNLGILVLNP
jgi:tryptophan-rich sensory protein